MTKRSYLVAYLGATMTLLLADAIWLGVLMSDYYRAQLGDMMREDVRLDIAALFYMFYTVGVVIFAVKPAYMAQRFKVAVLHGALFGFLAYGTYDVTNMATLDGWPVMMSVYDVMWGTFVTMISACAGYILLQKTK